MKCRHCKVDITLPFINLGSAPPSNAYLTEKTLKAPEKFFPLKVLVCESCWLVQTEDYTDAHQLFNDEYAYFSSISQSWLKHCEDYVKNITERFSLNVTHYIVEIAANDGYLLQYVMANGMACVGIEPTASTAKAARAKGIPIIEEFFGTDLSKKLVADHKQADLVIANNVLAHVPNVNDFVSGITLLLKNDGIATFEFPHLMRLVEKNQFDTIYHEHFSYLSFSAVNHIFTANGLSIFDVEEINTHGGSLRVFAQRTDTGKQPCSQYVRRLLQHENEIGVLSRDYYVNLQKKADCIKNEFLHFLLNVKKAGKIVVGYGAAAKGNTLMNYASIRPDLIPFIVDRNVEKQGKYMPGSRIPIYNEKKIEQIKPDYIIIFPWNLKTEIMQQLNYIKKWNGRFLITIPQLEVI